MKKIITLIIVIAVTQIPISCDQCGNEEPSEGRITELRSMIGTFENGKFLNEENNAFEKAAILIGVGKMEISQNTSIPENFKNPFLNQAYACDPPPPEPTQKINEIVITASQSIFSGGIEYKAGSNLKEIFKVSNHYDSSINGFILDQNGDLWLFGHSGSEMVLSLREKPDNSIDQKLKVKFEFSDLETIEVETQEFRVN